MRAHDPDHSDVAGTLSLDDVVRASQFGVRLKLDASSARRLDDHRASILARIEEDGDTRHYGFNTGFGDNRNRPAIPKDLRGTIQDNLVLSHSAGYGDPLPTEVVRAAMAIRARTLAIGHSGIRSRVLDSLCSLYNSGLVPCVPTFGSVGASGDLAPLSHMSLPLMGRGRVIVDGREETVTADLFGQYGLEPLTYSPRDEFAGTDGPTSTFGPKEGLALNNGTSFMAAHLAIAVHQFDSLLRHADLALSLNMQAMGGVLDAHQPYVQALRPHHSVNKSAARLLKFLIGSRLVVSGGAMEPFVTEFRTTDGVVDSVQDDYCLRCAPVVHGTAMDAVERAIQVVETEINSVTDNPLVFDDQVLSGAHFHGMPLAFAADQLRTGMAIVGGISERRVAKLMNDRRNYGLPRHLVLDDPHGIKSGWMIAQYCAASMVNELKTRSMPYCVGNVTTGNESEDFVSMGANACRAAYECVSVLKGIVAIELAASVRALLIRVGHVSAESDLSGTGLSSAAQMTIEAFRTNGIEVWHTDDRPLEPIIAQVTEMVGSGQLAVGS